ncbi:MAG: FAD/NAD(P)-binding protein [Cyanobacteria bacterium J06592_8]
MSDLVSVAIIGAGPQALTLATHLLQKKPIYRKITVFDSSGTWLSRWHHQFAAQEIPHLRSPVVHHPDPNPFALRKFAENRFHELFPPYDLPGTKLFEDFCEDVIQRWQLGARVDAAEVVNLLPLRGLRRPQFELLLADGRTVQARRVVLATGGGQVQLPDWVSKIPSPFPSERLVHSQQVDLRLLSPAGERVLLVGGGLTSAHLALGMIRRGATVTLMVRRQLREKLFDTEPGWLGPKYLKPFEAESCWKLRSQIIQQARDGGSITPSLMIQLRRAIRQGQLILWENCQVKAAIWENNWRVNCDRAEVKFDRIVLATGTKFDATQHPLLQNILPVYPTEIIDGLPVLDRHLRLPGCELFMMGGLAALQLGPVARNLAGARMASGRIVPAIVKPSLALTA